MIDEDINYVLLQINMSVPPANLENRRCVLVSLVCLHVHIFTNVVHIMSHAVKTTNIYLSMLMIYMFQVLKCQVSIWFLILINKY
jgi:hypothetical protein